MIVVTTDYDKVTQSLSLVAAQFVADAGTANPSWPIDNLVPRQASNLPNQAEVYQTLNSKPGVAVVFFGHGYDAHHAQPGFHGQDRAPVLDPAGAAILQNRVVVAVCCWSLNAMSTAALAHGATVVLGYDRELNVLFPTLPGLDAPIRSCLSAGLSLLVQGRTVTDARDETRRAFTILERQLMMKGHMSYQVASVHVKYNAQRHDIRGNGTATL